jgi:predicted CopG family antitoxin
MTYNLSLDTVQQLDKMKLPRETQDDLIRRLIIKSSDNIEEAANLKYLYEDALETVKDQRKQKAQLELKLKSLDERNNDPLSNIMRIF